MSKSSFEEQIMQGVYVLGRKPSQRWGPFHLSCLM
jgi:hypothetical protein